MYKIITVSNFNQESYRERVVAEHIEFKPYGETMLKVLRDTVIEGDSTWYVLVPQAQKLWLGMEEFVDTTCEACGADLYDKTCCLALLSPKLE